MFFNVFKRLKTFLTFRRAFFLTNEVNRNVVIQARNSWSCGGMCEWSPRPWETAFFFSPTFSNVFQCFPTFDVHWQTLINVQKRWKTLENIWKRFKTLIAPCSKNRQKTTKQETLICEKPGGQIYERDFVKTLINIQGWTYCSKQSVPWRVEPPEEEKVYI